MDKKGDPGKRRKIEKSITERKNKKIKTEIEKLTVEDPCTGNAKKITKKVCEEDRKKNNNEYISLNWKATVHYIKSLVKTKETKPETHNKLYLYFL